MNKVHILVNTDIIDLINANNVTIAADKSYKSVHCLDYQPPINKIWVLYQGLCNQSSVNRMKIIMDRELNQHSWCWINKEYTWVTSLKNLNTYVDPRTVPRMVWGLKNLQNASLNSENLLDNGLGPAAPTWEQAWYSIENLIWAFC